MSEIEQINIDAIDSINDSEEGVGQLCDLYRLYKSGTISAQRYLSAIDDLHDSAVISVCQGYKREPDAMDARRDAMERDAG